MSEQLDKFYYYRDAEMGIAEIQEEAEGLEAQGIMDKGQAVEAGECFLDITKRIANQHPAVHEVELTASGYDVLVPRLSVAREDDEVRLHIDPEASYDRVGSLEAVEGRFAQINVAHIEQDDSEGVQLRVNMFLARNRSALTVSLQQVPFLRLEPIELINVPLTSGADALVGVKVLELLRERQQAFTALSRNGLARSRYAKRLHALDAALAEEDEKYVALQNVKILHDIGRLGKRYADASPQLDEAVTDPLMKTLGVGRHVAVGADAIMQIDSNGNPACIPGVVNGKIIGVCSQVRGFSSDSLMLALAGDNMHSVSYVPLSKIEHFLF